MACIHRINILGDYYNPCDSLRLVACESRALDIHCAGRPSGATCRNIMRERLGINVCVPLIQKGS